MTRHLQAIREEIDRLTYAEEAPLVARLAEEAALDTAARSSIVQAATEYVRRLRREARPGLMEAFLAEYGLSTDEGVALMCLAEALLRVPDTETIDALIEDKIAASDWGRHLGHATSPLVNASTWALMLTGKVLKADEEPGPAQHLRAAIKRLGEPVIRTAVGRVMKEMGRQFVLGETIGAALARAERREAAGYTYSYDMLGEAAKTDADAARYHRAYLDAIAAIAKRALHDDIRRNPGISVKLSALHPRYEEAQRDRVMAELVPRLAELARAAAGAGMGLNVDAEEAGRLELSLDVMEAVLRAPELEGWDGFGLVVQAYGQRAGAVIDWAEALARELGRRIMVRLVKGAYWDTEIKRAQVKGMDGFPVFTRKAATDVSYLANARKLMRAAEVIYPQFATHNAHTAVAILHMAREEGLEPHHWEFQRLHGMGEALHEMIRAEHRTACRIYAPVGAHRDLLAYLVRRLLENGANSSFVNQVVNEEVPPEIVAADPFDRLEAPAPHIPTGREIFLPERVNSRGWDLEWPRDRSRIEAARRPWEAATWSARPVIAAKGFRGAAPKPVTNPATGEVVGEVRDATDAAIAAAFDAARPWQADANERARILNRAADLYEANHGELFALVAREAGKTIPDAVAELREAVDFLRYYAAHILDRAPLGRVVCISPWNFPLAIFTGQIAGALAQGNAVLAKPAEQTPLIACRAVELMHEAGVPVEALQLLPGDGRVGAMLTSDPRVNGVAFTGSTEVAFLIRDALARNARPGTPLIAETGGINAAIVDSTALPEQAVQAIIESAFQSAGQRCSALRCLYLQEEIAEDVLRMLKGAMDTLRLGDPYDMATDIGPLIDEEARTKIRAHVEKARSEGRVLHELPAPNRGTFLGPTLIRVGGISDIEQEVFGPVLHVATFAPERLDAVIAEINDTGYGLTFGLQTRIDDRVQKIAEGIHTGNIYVNRNQIGAVVGSQPFGGEGLSGTGPKAGGPHYLWRLSRAPAGSPGGFDRQMTRREVEVALAEARGKGRVDVIEMPGPTGEANRLRMLPREPILCLGPGPEAVKEQVHRITTLGGAAAAATGRIDPELLVDLAPLGGVVWWGDDSTGRALATALTRRPGPIVPLVTVQPDPAHARLERHLCIDTTAAGGNAALLGALS